MKLSRHLYAILGLVTVLSAISMSSAHYKAPAPPAGSNVTVANGTNNPVPTMSMGGTVSVSTLPPVTVSGTPNVNIANTPTVNFANGATVKVDDSTPIAVHEALPRNRVFICKNGADTMAAGDATASAVLYTVPAGKQVEIKDAHFFAFGLSGQSICSCAIGSDQVPYFHPIHVDTMAVDPSNTARWQGAMEGFSLVIPAGATVRVGVRRDNFTNSMEVDAGFTGYLEDAP